MHAGMRALGLACVLVLTSACGDDGPAPPDAPVVTTELCTYVPVAATANATGSVTAGALTAGAADRVLDVPVGTALGGYTARSGFLGSAGVVDSRSVKLSGSFNPSIGVTSAPRVKVVALTAGGETVLIVKVDLIFTYEGMVFDLEQRLGAEYAGKVMIASSHSHSAWAQFTAHGPLKLGSGELRDVVYKRLLDTMEVASRDALAARRPAKLGVHFDGNWDPTDLVNRDRRGDNDDLPNGDKKDDKMYMLRLDGMDDAPIAAMFVFGEHGTLNDDDNPFASTDATGALERVFQEQFDEEVVVMHLQSAGGDNSPTGHGRFDCTVKPGKPGDPCFLWGVEEGHGRAALPLLAAAYTAAGATMRDTLEIEMVTRSIETGPLPESFAIRDGALSYTAFDGVTEPDREILVGGEVKSPIDEFNAPVGAALCETDTAMFPSAAIPGTEGLLPYGSCLRLDLAAPILGPIFKLDFQVDETHPVCESTRTTISALRLGDYVFGTMPGELTVMLAEHLRSKSTIAADHLILVGYAQGHVGYLLRPEDWLRGGYESTITFWGPLEAERIGEQLLGLLPLAMTSAREDVGSTSATRVAVPVMVDGLEVDNPAPDAGTVPATVPAETWSRIGTLASAQPAATISRISGIATFAWYGDDPQVKTPRVTLQYEAVANSGNFANVRRKSGRVVEDAELVLAYTPVPLVRTSGTPQHHVWVAEWQAVPWVGAAGIDALEQRGAVPAGRYRFHVEGAGWMVDSTPFTVEPGGLAIGSALRTGGEIVATAQYSAPNGWRLMHMTQLSNQPVALGGTMVKVQLLAGTAPVGVEQTVTSDANGVVRVPDNVAATAVRLTDLYGNTQTRTLP